LPNGLDLDPETGLVTGTVGDTNTNGEEIEYTFKCNADGYAINQEDVKNEISTKIHI
jgi:hypothetical protein